MPSEYELSDISVPYKSDTSLNRSFAGNNGKMYVSQAKAFILAFLAIAIAVGVGVIVYFAGPANKDVECKCTFPEVSNPGGTAAGLEQCTDWVTEGSTEATEICNACPNTGTPATCPPTPQVTTAAPTAAPTTTTQPDMTTATTPAPPVRDVRLPTSLDPVLYTVELQPNMYAPLQPEQFTFNGSVTVLVNCKMATRNITLHTNKLNISVDLITVSEENGFSVLKERVEFDTERQFLIIHTTQDMVPGRNYTVRIPHFVGPLVPDLAGLYLSSYKRGNETIYLATTLMAPIDARKTLPCFDEPSFRAKFDVVLLRKEPKISISNMPIRSSENRADGWIADTFETTPKMSTYLLAFIICDFNYTENTTTNGVKYRAWSRPEAIDQTPYSLQVGVDILTYFEEYFNISYPLPKQDMIAIPDFAAGAMENWGLITYRETAMLYEKGVSSEGNKQRVAVVVSHELAHQWFGNLVTPSWWDDLWLNEGFASYVEYMGVDHVHPDWKMFEQFVVEDLQDVFRFDGLISSHPVYVPVNHPDEINEIFDRISYAKGASIIRMMRFFLGNSAFQHGLTRYLNELAYGAAFHDDLWFALGNQSLAENNAITNVKEIMDTWTLQMNYPIVMVTHKPGGQISLTQTRYLQDRNATDPGKFTSPFDYKWNIPFTYTTSMSPRFSDISNADVKMFSRQSGELSIDSSTIPAPGGNNWVLGNPMQYGYYRTNYEESNWLALINQLKTNHQVIHSINRAQIINDAWNLVKSGDLRMEIALQTIEYLDKEREFVAWSAAQSELGYVGAMLERHPLFGDFSKFMRNKTLPAFEELTMNNTDAKHLESYMRSTISGLACAYGIPACLEEAKRLYKEWMNNPSVNPIDPGLKSTVYCKGVAEGGVEEWEFALNQYRNANLAAEKSRLLSAMACSRETWILSRYLEMSVDPTEIRRQDTVSVMVSISNNVIGRPLVWDFFRGQWDFLINDYLKNGGLFQIPRLIGGVTKNLNKQLELSQVLDRIKKPSTYLFKIVEYFYEKEKRHGRQLYVFTKLILGITYKFVTDYELHELKDFIESRPTLGSGERAFAQALEKTQSNINWMDANVPIIEKWLMESNY